MSADTLQRWLDRADALCAAGRFFEAHEELEAPWKEAGGAEKRLLQGVIQLAAGLHRLRLPADERGDSAYLLRKGLEKLRAERALLEPEPLEALELVVEELAAGRRTPPPALRLSLRTRPGR